MQNKFTSLSLAFKTDKLTLTNRLELQQRQRDNAEKNIETEITQLKKAIEVRKPILLFTYLSFQGIFNVGTTYLVFFSLNQKS